MSEKTVEENFWTKIERDGGFRLGEMVVMYGKRDVGKSCFSEHLLKEANQPVVLFNVEVNESDIASKVQER